MSDGTRRKKRREEEDRGGEQRRKGEEVSGCGKSPGPRPPSEPTNQDLVRTSRQRAQTTPRGLTPLVADGASGGPSGESGRGAAAERTAGERRPTAAWSVSKRSQEEKGVK